MWNFFSRETFPYEIGDKDDAYVGYSVFSLHKGVKKSSGETVSIFSYSVKSGNTRCLENARITVKKLKTLKHPFILTFIDSYEDDNAIHLVTENVVPLFSYLKKIQNEGAGENYLKWGLKSIGEAVTFLNENSQQHNNIFHGAVFVDSTGSWKLGEVGYISNVNASYPNKVVDNLYKYNLPKVRTNSESWCADFWGLGILTWEVFNGELNTPENLTKPKKIPSQLSSNFLELTGKNVSKEDSITRFILRCSQNNLLASTLDNLSNYHLKDKDVKSKVCKDLLTLLPTIPKDVILNKILKLLKQAYEFDVDNSVFLVPVVTKIPAIVTEEEFQNSVEQFIITLFSSNDRATRLALLMSIEEIVNKINKKSINDLFPYFSTGFLDSNPKIRGETVKALVHFAPKLSKKQLNDDALRNLLQIQTKDPEPYIRTNTTICLGKIAHCLLPESRKKILITAFLHALRDSCPAVRNAGAQAFAVTHNFFPLELIARNILPGLICLTIDNDATVRQNALKTIKMLLSKLEKFSESPEMKDELEKDVLSQTCENNSSVFNVGWAFSAITSKFLKPVDTKTKSVDIEQSEHNKVISGETVIQRKESTSKESFQQNHFEEEEKHEACTNSENDEDEDKSDWENDGWGEAHEEVLKPIEVPKNEHKKSKEEKKKNSSGPMKLGTRLGK